MIIDKYKILYVNQRSSHVLIKLTFPTIYPNFVVECKKVNSYSGSTNEYDKSPQEQGIQNFSNFIE